MKTFFGAIVALALGVSPALADPPLLNTMFQDHAVLQRGQPIRVWGQAAAGDTISVTLSHAHANARADASGNWRATLPSQQAGGPYTLTAHARSGATQTVSDVLIGDVWLCSGQSNMVLEVRRTLDSRAEMANADNSTLRMLAVPLTSSTSPQTEFGSPVHWQIAAPGAISEWSATCYYFARELQKMIHVPMGMVNSSWGGSNIQTWMSEAAVRAAGGYDERLDVLHLSSTDPNAATRRWGEIWQNWWRAHAAAGSEPWRESEDATGWTQAPAGLGFWENWGVPALANFNGMVWYRTNVQLTAAQAAQAATLSLGTIDEIDETWVNGGVVGATSGAGTQRLYPLSAGSLHAGVNSIVVNAVDTYATGGMYGPAENRALRLADGTALPLTGWRYQIAPNSMGYPPRMPWEATGGLTTIHNGMITPIGPYNFRGVVWYQGESNTGEPETYRALLHGLMADWRGKYGADLPFLIVQLAGYGPAASSPANPGIAQLREAQRLAVLDDAHAGLAVAIDIGERNDVHPANKQEIGRRLARAARHVVYGEAIAPSGPIPRSATHTGADIVVAFGDVDRSLITYGAERPIGFELCGAAQETCRFVDARISGDRVALTVPGGLTPTRVRFCWAESPICTLYDESGWPAGPFEIPIS